MCLGLPVHGHVNRVHDPCELVITSRQLGSFLNFEFSMGNRKFMGAVNFIYMLHGSINQYLGPSWPPGGIFIYMLHGSINQYLGPSWPPGGIFIYMLHGSINQYLGPSWPPGGIFIYMLHGSINQYLGPSWPPGGIYYIMATRGHLLHQYYLAD